MRILVRLLLAATSLFLSLLLAEVSLSYITHTRILERWSKLQRLGERFVKEPVLQWRYKKNLRAHRACHTNSLHCNTLSTDEYGMRNPTGTLKNGTVAFLGDSFFSPEWVKRKESFYVVYAQHTGQKVASVATSGWSLEHYVAAARHLIVPQASTKHVLVGVYINDWHTYKVKNGQKWPTLNDVTSLQHKPKWQLGNPLFFDHLQSSIQEMTAHSVSCKGNYVPIRNRTFEVLCNVMRPFGQAVRKGTTRKLTELKRLLQQALVPKTLTVLFIPTATAVYAKEIQKVCPNCEPYYQLKQERILAETLQEWGKEHRIRILNPLQMMQQQRRKNPPLFLSRDTHWSPVGHRLLGRWLAKRWKVSGK